MWDLRGGRERIVGFWGLGWELWLVPLVRAFVAVCVGTGAAAVGFSPGGLCDQVWLLVAAVGRNEGIDRKE